MERSGYNGNTYREEYDYDVYRDQLEKLTAYENNAQKAQNTMTYLEGELSEVTDGKSKYKFVQNKETDTSTFGVYEGATLKTLEQQVSNQETDTVTHT